EVVPLYAVDAEVQGELHHVGQLAYVRLEESELESHATAVAALRGVRIAHRDELTRVVDDSVPPAAEHDAFVGLLRRAVPRDLHVGGHRHDELRPCLRSKPRKRAVRREVQLHVVASAEIDDSFELLVEERLAHRRWDDLLEPARSGLRDDALDHVERHEAARATLLLAADL